MRRKGGELGVGFFPLFHLGLKAEDHGSPLFQLGVELGDHVCGGGALRKKFLGERLVFCGEPLDLFFGGDLRGLGGGDLPLGVAEFEHRVAQRVAELALHRGLLGRVERRGQREGKHDGASEDARHARFLHCPDRVHGQNFELMSIWMMLVLYWGPAMLSAPIQRIPT